MGKGINLWDDSVLVDAFDHAIATYKAMHVESYPSNSAEKENHTSASNEKEPMQAELLTRQIDHEDNQNSPTKGLKETQFPSDKNEATTCGVQVQENNLNADLCATKSDPYMSGFLVNSGQSNYCSDQKIIEYNELLKQYYEIEEQRQKVLQQLQHASYGNYETPVESGEVQQQEVQANNSPENGMHPPCFTCGCHFLASPFIPISVCSSGGLSCGNYNSCPLSCSTSHANQTAGCQLPGQSSDPAVTTKQYTQPNDDTVKLGMMAVERAISFMKEEISTDCNVCEEEKAKDKAETSGEYERKASECIGQETDLTVVLSAWYSAGFHTGRYLTEQSRKKA